jgi:hypothetical protein
MPDQFGFIAGVDDGEIMQVIADGVHLLGPQDRTNQMSWTTVPSAPPSVEVPHSIHTQVTVQGETAANSGQDVLSPGDNLGDLTT